MRINYKIILPLLFFLAIGIVIIIAMHSKDEKEKLEAEKNKLELEKKSQITQTISNISKRYNAIDITDWDKIISNGNSRINEFYTFQIEDVLVRSDRRPILFLNSINDIMRKENKYYLHFEPYSGIELFATYFILECDSSQINKIMDQKEQDQWGGKYAVIALISSIKKPNFTLNGNNYAEIFFEPSNYVLIANGICLDMLFIESLN